MACAASLLEEGLADVAELTCTDSQVVSDNHTDSDGPASELCNEQQNEQENNTVNHSDSSAVRKQPHILTANCGTLSSNANNTHNVSDTQTLGSNPQRGLFSKRQFVACTAEGTKYVILPGTNNNTQQNATRIVRTAAKISVNNLSSFDLTAKTSSAATQLILPCVTASSSSGNVIKVVVLNKGRDHAYFSKDNQQNKASATQVKDSLPSVFSHSPHNTTVLASLAGGNITTGVSTSTIASSPTTTGSGTSFKLKTGLPNKPVAIVKLVTPIASKPALEVNNTRPAVSVVNSSLSLNAPNLRPLLPKPSDSYVVNNGTFTSDHINSRRSRLIEQLLLARKKKRQRYSEPVENNQILLTQPENEIELSENEKNSENFSLSESPPSVLEENSRKNLETSGNFQPPDFPRLSPIINNDGIFESGSLNDHCGTIDHINYPESTKLLRRNDVDFCQREEGEYISESEDDHIAMNDFKPDTEITAGPSATAHLLTGEQISAEFLQQNLLKLPYLPVSSDYQLGLSTFSDQEENSDNEHLRHGGRRYHNDVLRQYQSDVQRYVQRDVQRHGQRDVEGHDEKDVKHPFASTSYDYHEFPPSPSLDGKDPLLEGQLQDHTSTCRRPVSTSAASYLLSTSTGTSYYKLLNGDRFSTATVSSCQLERTVLQRRRRRLNNNVNRRATTATMGSGFGLKRPKPEMPDEEPTVFLNKPRSKKIESIIDDYLRSVAKEEQENGNAIYNLAVPPGPARTRKVATFTSRRYREKFKTQPVPFQKRVSTITSRKPVQKQTVQKPCFGNNSKQRIRKRVHVRRIRWLEKVVCSRCGNTHPKHRLFNHIERVHEQVRHFQCNICKGMFFNLPHYKLHMRTHTGEKPFGCSHCSMRFSRGDALKFHVARVHKEGPNPSTIACAHCLRRFFTRYQIAQHLAAEHGGVKAFECHVCGARFASQIYLTKHVAWHKAERPYVCADCGAAYKHSSKLWEHMKRHERQQKGGVPRYKCAHCQKAYVQKHNIRDHIAREHCGEKKLRKNARQTPKKTRLEDVQMPMGLRTFRDVVNMLKGCRVVLERIDVNKVLNCFKTDVNKMLDGSKTDVEVQHPSPTRQSTRVASQK